MDADVQALVERLHSSRTMSVIAVSGAGAMAVTWVLGVTGASRTVLEILIPYSPRSLIEFIGYEPSRLVSAKTASQMAKIAYRRAVHLRQGDVPVIGVACTATIATDRNKRGEHRCHVAVWTPSRCTTNTLGFRKGLRGRAEEDDVVSRLVLRTLSEAAGLDNCLPLKLHASEQITTDSILYQDVIEAVLADHISTATLHTDSKSIADGRVKGGILSGSFRPLHKGHEMLAVAASQILGTNTTFELSVTNVDKRKLTDREVRNRASHFVGKGNLVVTNAPLFHDKAGLFPECTFVVGWDTATRVVDPTYYDGGEAAMISSLGEIRNNRCRFLVAGRQKGSIFHSPKEINIPYGFDDMFEAIPASVFRYDMSSTEARLVDRKS